MRYAAGQYLNLLQLAKAVTSSPAANGTFPLANLYDDRPSQPFLFSSAGTDPTITVDLDRLGGFGDFEVWPGPSGWTVTTSGTGAVAQEAALFHGGAAAAKLTGGTGTAQVHRDVTARAGERMTIDAWLRGDGTANARLRIQNRQTGKYLASNGTWSASAVDVAARSTASYAQTVVDFQVEAFAVCQVATVTLRVLVLVNQSGSGYADDVALYPTVNICSIHGHNIDALNTVELRSSSDNFGAVDTLQATLAMRRPTFYGYLTVAIKRRYWRLKLTGTNTAAIYIGELVLAYAETVLRNQQWGFEVQQIEPQIRTSTSPGETTVYPETQDGHRAIKLSFAHNAVAKYQEARDEIMRRTRGGQWLILVVPMDDEEDVLLARIDNTWSVRRAFISRWENEMMFSEGPFPSVIA